MNSNSIFPGLNNYELKEGKLKKVDGFEAKEISSKIGKILFNNDDSEEDTQINTDLNIWYLPDDESLPLMSNLHFTIVQKKEKIIQRILSSSMSLYILSKNKRSKQI